MERVHLSRSHSTDSDALSQPDPQQIEEGAETEYEDEGQDSGMESDSDDIPQTVTLPLSLTLTPPQRGRGAVRANGPMG